MSRAEKAEPLIRELPTADRNDLTPHRNDLTGDRIENHRFAASMNELLGARCGSLFCRVCMPELLGIARQTVALGR